MKKLLLFVMVVGFAFASIAQNQMTKKENVYLLRTLDTQEVVKPQNQPAPVLNPKVTNEDINRIFVGTAINQRILRREEIKGVAYNAELDIISVGFVLDPEAYTGIDEGGVVAQIYSADHGQTWSAPVIINDEVSGGPNYYISSAIYNPEGNTDIDNAFGVYQGTINPASGVWHYKAFGSNNFGGENLTTELIEASDDEEDNGYWNVFGLTQAGDEARCMNLYPTGSWGGYTAIALEPIYGEFSGTDFEWDFDSPVEVELIEDEANGGAFWQGRWQGYDASTEMAWSADGEIGYMWVLGISSDEFSGVQPQVYMTEDGGDSWDYIYLDFQTDEMQALLDPFMIESWAGYMTPAFFESAGVVNSNGDLEIFGAMGAHSADVFNYPDSINWQYTYPGDIANITVNADGLTNLIWVDSLLTENVLAATEGNYAGSGWQHRLHAARNDEGSQVFLTWTETAVEGAEFNLNPDIFGWTKGPEGIQGPINFTAGTLYETFYYFNSSADLVFENEDGGYTIPTIQGITPSEFQSNGNAATDPITINYITGIEFVNLTVGLEELAQSNRFTVTQNTPNPFNGTTTISVSTETTSAVIVEVSNIIGQTIYTVNSTVNGTKEITLSSDNMKAGVYFYTVSVGEQTITKKMVVK